MARVTSSQCLRLRRGHAADQLRGAGCDMKGLSLSNKPNRLTAAYRAAVEPEGRSSRGSDAMPCTYRHPDGVRT